MNTSPITTHVLDTARGCPAAGIAVQLERQDPSGGWQVVGLGTTNADGRIADLTKEAIIAAAYRITFATKEYFAALGTIGFYPSVSIEFEIDQPDEHYHVPLLLSPFGYSTYRGS